MSQKARFPIHTVICRLVGTSAPFSTILSMCTPWGYSIPGVVYMYTDRYSSPLQYFSPLCYPLGVQCTWGSVYVHWQVLLPPRVLSSLCIHPGGIVYLGQCICTLIYTPPPSSTTISMYTPCVYSVCTWGSVYVMYIGRYFCP